MSGQRINIYFTAAVLLMVSSFDCLFENQPPLHCLLGLQIHRPCSRPTKSELLTLGPEIRF